MKFSILVIEEVIKKVADEELQNAQSNGVAISKTLLHTQLDWFIVGAKSTCAFIDFNLVAVPVEWEKYFLREGDEIAE